MALPDNRNDSYYRCRFYRVKKYPFPRHSGIGLRQGTCISIIRIIHRKLRIFLGTRFQWRNRVLSIES
jgi:hypothetical protein